MNVLIIGRGGREHALAWAIAKSPELDTLYVAPGNGGTREIAANVDISPGDIDGLIDFAERNDVALTVVGPEAPLVAGIVDRFEKAGRRCFGPRRAAARLEGSKVFAKEFMKKYAIPTAEFAVCTDVDEANSRVEKMGAPVVVKADGLAAGKGVIIANTIERARAAIDEIMVERRFGESGGAVVVEEYLEGEELSVHSICAGEDAVLFPGSQDHKRILDGDDGPNTGGMGAYAPVRSIDDAQMKAIRDTIVLPTLRGMKQEGAPFTGVLYAGLMMTGSGPRVLEYNVRFGDPETQVLLPLLESDLLTLLNDAARGALPGAVAFHEHRYAATVVMASEGYPGAYEKGKTITGIGDAKGKSRTVFHAGTARAKGAYVTAGGRVLAVTAWGSELAAAITDAYAGVAVIGFEGAYWRRDIGRKAI